MKTTTERTITMSLPALWMFMSWLGCCVGYVIIQPPAQYYEYQSQPTYQWKAIQPYSYQPSYYNSYYYNYPSAYAAPEHYNSYPDQSNNYDSYHYYYPSGYGQPDSYISYPHKPALKHCPSYNEGQKLLQVYRLIRVIEIFRTPPSKQRKMTSLDRLVERLTKQSLQHQLVELVEHVDGYEEVVSLDRGPPGIKLDMFVDDIARLLLAIQRALNALDLDIYGGYHHGCCELHRELCAELRHLRDQANELSVAQIKSEMVKHIKAKVKQAFDTDILEDLDEDLESRLLELEGMDIDLSAMEKAQVSKVNQLDGSPWEALLSAPELTLEQHTIIKVHPTQEKHEEETVKYPPHEYPLSSTTNTPVTVSNAPTTVEDVKASLIGSLSEKLNSLPGGHHAVGNKRPGVPAKPVVEESNKLDVPLVVNTPKNVVHHFDEPTSVENANFISTWAHSVPLWLTKNPESQEGHYQNAVNNVGHEVEHIAANEAAVQQEPIEDPLVSYDLFANLIDELQKSTPRPIFDGQQTFHHHNHHHQNAVDTSAVIQHNKDTSSSSLNGHKVNADRVPSESPMGHPSILSAHAEESHHSRNDDLISTLQHIVGEQIITNENLGKEENKVPLVPDAEYTTSTMPTTVQPAVTVASRNSWLGSLLGNGYLLPVSQTTEPMELIEPVTEEDNQMGDRIVLTVEDVVKANAPEFDVDQSSQTPEHTTNRTSAVSAVYQSVASWLRKNPEQRTLEDEDVVKDSSKEVDGNIWVHPTDEPKPQPIEDEGISAEARDRFAIVSSIQQEEDDMQDTFEPESTTEQTTSITLLDNSEKHTEHTEVKSREGEHSIPVETVEEYAVEAATLQPTDEEAVEFFTTDALEEAAQIIAAEQTKPTISDNQELSTNSSTVRTESTERSSSESPVDQSTGPTLHAEEGQHSKSDDLATAMELNEEGQVIPAEALGKEQNTAQLSFVQTTVATNRESWLDSLFGKGYLLPIGQTAQEVSHPTELVETSSSKQTTSPSPLHNSEEHTKHAALESREGELSIPVETAEVIAVEEATLQPVDERVVDVLTVDKLEEATTVQIPGNEQTTHFQEMITERSTAESSEDQTTDPAAGSQHFKSVGSPTALELHTEKQVIYEEVLGREESAAQLPVVSTTTEAARESWFGSLFGIRRTTDEDSQPTGLFKALPDEDNKRSESVEKVVNTIHSSQSAESTSNRTSAVSAVYNSVASWLRKSPEQQKLVADDSIEVADEEARELPEDEPKPQLIEKEDEGADQPEPVFKSGLVDELTEPQQENRHGLLETSTERNTTTAVVHEEPVSVESRDGELSIPKIATFDSDVRHFSKDEIYDVLTSLEEANGFTGLKNQIPAQDVDQLVESLSDVRTDIRWTEMISGLQKLVADKHLNNGERIIDALGQWQKDDIDTAYDVEDDAEIRRELGDEEDDDLESIQENATDDQANSEDTVINNSTEAASVDATASSDSSQREDIIIGELGKTTPQPFRADETKLLAMD